MNRLTPWLAGAMLVITFSSGLAGQATDARPLSLEEALRLARPASEAVGLARVAVDRARGQHQVARSGLLPQLTGSLSYTRQLRSQFENVFGSTEPDTASVPAPSSCDAFAADPTRPIGDRLEALERSVACVTTVNPFGSFSNLPFGQRNTYTLGLSASQMIFDGGRTLGQIRAANAGRASAAIGVTAAEAQLIVDVVNAYYDAALGDRLVEIATTALAQSDTTLAQTRLRHELGTVAEFDLLRATVARDNQRPVVIQAQTRRDLAHLRLRQVLDLKGDEPLTLTTALTDTALSSTPSLAAMASASPDTAAANRATVRQAAEAVRAQEGLDQASRAQRLPALTLSSQYTRIAYPSRAFPAWDEFLTDWNVALGVQVPIFTGGRLSGDRTQARAAVAEAKLRYQQASKAAALDGYNAVAQRDAALAAWAASDGTATQAARAYQIAELRFREGISTQTELLDARLALQQAETNRAQAARDLQIAKVRLALLADLPLGAGDAGNASQAAAPASSQTQVAPRAATAPTGNQRLP